MSVIMKDEWRGFEYNTEAGCYNSFECDELIAPVIILLNKKGYQTEHCCSGHLYGDMDEVIYCHEDKEEADIFKIFPSTSHYYKVGNNCFRLIVDNMISSDCYISFNKSVKEFETLPDGFRQEKTEKGEVYISAEIIRLDSSDEYRKLQENNPYSFFEKRTKLMKSLYEWVQKLPDKKKN